MASRQPRFPTWTPIAARERTSSCVWETVFWVAFPDATVSPEEARVLGRTGQLLVATRNDPEFVCLCVKTPASRS